MNRKITNIRDCNNKTYYSAVFAVLDDRDEC